MTQSSAPFICRTCNGKLDRDPSTGAIGCGNCRYEIEVCQACGKPPAADAAPWNIPQPYCGCPQPQVGRTLSPKDLANNFYKR